MAGTPRLWWDSPPEATTTHCVPEASSEARAKRRFATTWNQRDASPQRRFVSVAGIARTCFPLWPRGRPRCAANSRPPRLEPSSQNRSTRSERSSRFHARYRDSTCRTDQFGETIWRLGMPHSACCSGTRSPRGEEKQISSPCSQAVWPTGRSPGLRGHSPEPHRRRCDRGGKPRAGDPVACVRDLEAAAQSTLDRCHCRPGPPGCCVRTRKMKPLDRYIRDGYLGGR